MRTPAPLNADEDANRVGQPITPQEFFPGDRNGYYHARAYSACASKVEPARSTGEWKALRRDPSVLNRLAGHTVTVTVLLAQHDKL